MGGWLVEVGAGEVPPRWQCWIGGTETNWDSCSHAFCLRTCVMVQPKLVWVPLVGLCLRSEGRRCLLTSPDSVGYGWVLPWGFRLLLSALAQCRKLTRKDSPLEALTLLRGWVHRTTLQSIGGGCYRSEEALCNKVMVSQLACLDLRVNVASLWLVAATTEWGPTQKRC